MLAKIIKEVERLKKKLFRSGKKDKAIEGLQHKLDNLPYEIYDKVKCGNVDIQIPIIKGIEETLDKIIRDKCSISRFGDGEFGVMFGSRIRYHDRNNKLVQRLKEVISSENPKLLIGLPPCFGSLDYFVPSTIDFWRKWMSKKRAMVYSCLDMNRVYYNAFFNRYYLNYKKTEEHLHICRRYFKRLKELWKDRDVVLFESQNARLGVANDLFEGPKSMSRIVFCPVKNAFDRYDEILSAFDDIDTNALILLALGPTATVLAHDLCNKGCQAVDLGLIGEEYERFLREEAPLELKSIGRNSKMKHASNPDDPEYKKQIVKKID